MRYTSASTVMLEHRYPGSTIVPHDHDLVSDRVVREMFGRRSIRSSSYGGLPVVLSSSMQVQPVLAAGIDTGSVHLVPVSPDPELTPGAELGIEMGFSEFLKEHKAFE